jgi:arylsulfate sulfotransferase
MPQFLKPACLAIVGMLTFCTCDPVEIEIVPDPPMDGCRFHVSDSNIVVSVTEVQDSMVFLLEDNKRIARSTSCFWSVQVDSANWMVEIVYSDSILQFTPFLGNSFVIEEDSIQLNPYGRAPLAAQVKFSLPVRGRIRLTVHGRNEESPDISHTFDGFEQHHTIPVYGLYVDFENTVTISVLDYFGNERISRDITIQTGPRGTVICGQMQVNINEYTGDQKKKFFLVQNAIYDTEGYIRWYAGYISNKYFALSNGLIAIQLLNDKGEPATLIEDIRIMNLMGQVVQLVDVPNRPHHEIMEKSPGGNLLVATNAQPYQSTADDTEDMIVEIDRISGEVIKSWNLREIFDPSRPRLWTEMPNDWCHLNSIEYDSTDHTLLISSKLQYFISKIDYETGQIKWIFGNHENWNEPWQEYLLTPTNFDTLVHPDRDWVYAQHMPRMTGEGTVIVYDNGRSRPEDDFTRILEFRVDETNMTVEKIWTHDFSYSTRTMGSVQVFEDDNVLIGHGEKGTITEVTREGEVVFDARLGYFYRAYPVQFY